VLKVVGVPLCVFSRAASFGGRNGVGIDIGAVYEYRDEDQISTLNYENTKFKIGFSIQDIGLMKYSIYQQ
jgi:hypothetical protein